MTGPVRLVPIVLALACVCAGGCGTDAPDAPDAPVDPVSVSIDAAATAGGAGPPDAGVATGHGGDPTLVADGPTLTVRGTVRPPSSEVRVSGEAAEVGPDGKFTATVSDLGPGENTIEVVASRPGSSPWRRALRVLRR